MNTAPGQFGFTKVVNFHPGDEWFTYNIYSGITILDSIIQDMYNRIEFLLKKDLISSFFFIRYRDPHFHLRLRFKITKTAIIGNIIEYIFTNSLKPYLCDHLIWKTTITGYTRETLRYGTLGIEVIENIFAKGSLITLKNLKTSPKRWDLAITYINAIFDLMAFEIKERASFCKRMKEVFFKEFYFDKNIKNVLRIKYSKYYNEINSVLRRLEPNNSYSEYYFALSDDFEKMRGLFNFYPPSAIGHIVASIIHMELNRIFVNNSREKEAIIYYLLDRYYAQELNSTKNKYINGIN